MVGCALGRIRALFGLEKHHERLTPPKRVQRGRGWTRNKAECVVVYPSVKKAACLVGGSYGRGVITCRSGEEFRGTWSASDVRAGGGSFGLQIGGEATDFVLLVMNEKGADSVCPKMPSRCGDTRRRCRMRWTRFRS